MDEAKPITLLARNVTSARHRWIGWLGLGLALCSFCTWGCSAWPAVVVCTIALLACSARIPPILGLGISLSVLYLFGWLNFFPSMLQLMPGPLQDFQFKFASHTDFHPLLHLDNYQRTYSLSSYYGMGGSESCLKFARKAAASIGTMRDELASLMIARGWKLTESKPEYLKIGDEAERRIDQTFTYLHDRAYPRNGWGPLVDPNLKNDLLFERPLDAGDSRKIYLTVHIYEDEKTVGLFCDGAR